MKILPILLCLSISCFAAEDLVIAEKLFGQGKLDECALLINKLQTRKMGENERVRLAAMQEYISGSSQEKIEKEIKISKELRNQNFTNPEDLFFSASLLIRRAENWKSRDIPEYQELSDTAAKLLKKVNDGGNSAIAIRTILLQCRNLAINGEYNNAARLVTDALNHYFPDFLRNDTGKAMPEVAGQLLILLGDQYTAIGKQDFSEKGKIKYFSSAAQCYVRAGSSLKESDPQFKQIQNKLLFCRETLRLLGYDLKLPGRIQLNEATLLEMIDSMLQKHLYSDVINVTKNKSSTEMQIRHAQALLGTKQYTEALRNIKTLSLEEKHAPLIFKLAMLCKTAKQNRESLELFRILTTLVPDSPDMEQFYLECANLCLLQKEFTKAGEFFIQASEKADLPEKRISSLKAAAESYYHGNAWEKSLHILERLPFDNTSGQLGAQAALNAKQYKKSLIFLEKILALPNLSKSQKRNTLLLAATAYGGLNDPEKNAFFLRKFLTEFPDDAYAREALLRLLDFYGRQKNYGELLSLAKYVTVRQIQDSASLLVRILKILKTPKERNLIAEMLLNIPEISSIQLLELLPELQSDKQRYALLKKHLSHFRSTTDEVCELYFIYATLCRKNNNAAEALKTTDILLKQKKIYRFHETTLLHASVLTTLKHHEEARQDYQKLLQSNLSSEQTRKVILSLVESWISSGEYKKAIISAWSAIPADLSALNSDEKNVIRLLLDHIISAADKTESFEDKEDAIEIRKKMEK